MISFVVQRGPGNAHFDQMLKIWKWCEQTFGKSDCLITWDGYFANNTENYVEFVFYKEAYADVFCLRWNDYIISKEEQYMLGIA